jgi:hypothetical protein
VAGGCLPPPLTRSATRDNAGFLDAGSQVGLNEFVFLYGLHDRQIERIVKWYTSREAAQAELAAALRDEPGWVTKLEIVRVDFDGAGVRVERA